MQAPTCGTECSDHGRTAGRTVTAAIVLTKTRREAIWQARTDGKRRERMELPPRAAGGDGEGPDGEVEHEKPWIGAKSQEAKQRLDAQVQRSAAQLGNHQWFQMWTLDGCVALR
jgi:hypothetical protein